MDWCIFDMRLFIFIFLFITSKPLLACTVCGFGQDGSQWAFLFTTALMTVVPLALVGGIIFYIYKKYQKLASEEAGPKS